MRKLFALLIALCLVLIILPTQANATTVASGTCGSAVNWSLDDSGILTISGSGALNVSSHYCEFGHEQTTYDSRAPWYDYSSSITAVNIQSGITGIGFRAFYGCTSLTAVSIPASVTSIGNGAFHNCYNLTHVYYGGTESQWNAISKYREFELRHSESCEYWKNGYVGSSGDEDTSEFCTVLYNSDLLDAVRHYGADLTALQSANLPTTCTTKQLYKCTICNDCLMDLRYVGSHTFENGTCTVCSVPEALKYKFQYGEVTITDCTATEIEIPAAIEGYPVARIGRNALMKARTIRFRGDAPSFHKETFGDGDTAFTIYYPADNPTWTREVRKSYGGDPTWIPYGAVAAPKNVTASNNTSTGKPIIKWDANAHATEYRIYRATSKDGTYTQVSSTTGTTYTDKDAVAGKQYCYKIKAVNTVGDVSDYSSHAARTCDLPQPVVEETNVASSGKVKLTWQKISGAEKYKIYRRVGKTGEYEYYKSTTSTSFTDSDNKAGTVYYYKVKAAHSNSSANSAQSAPVGQTCHLAQPVVEETNVASTGKVKLTWQKISGTEKYKIYRRVGKTGEYEYYKSTTSTSFTDSDNKVGKVYYYKVKAAHSNSNADSVKSAPVGQTCHLARPDVSVKLSSGKPKLKWEEDMKATKYYIYRATSEKGDYTKIATVIGGTHTDKTAKSGKTYYYKVKAIYSQNTSANSAYSSVDKIKVY